MNDNTLYWIWLSCGLGAGAPCLEPISFYEWNPEIIYSTAINEQVLEGVSSQRLKKLRAFPLSKAREIMAVCEKNGWEILTPSHKYYPKNLLNLQDFPITLYCKGDPSVFENELFVSVVGARKASDYGRAVASALSGALAGCGFTVASGGALGIDSAAHWGALREKGKTVCVLGCGFGTDYLRENQALRREISQNGAVITEFPPFFKANKLTFPIRNRIISGISLGTVVVEAGEKSGSLITARLAGEQGRDVFAVPGDLVSSSFLGTNNLIRNGAIPVFSPNDILEEYHRKYFHKFAEMERLPDDEIIKRAQELLKDDEFLQHGKPAEVKKETAPAKKETAKAKAEEKPQVKAPAPDYLTPSAKKIYEFLDFQPIHVDDIKSGCELKINETLSALTELEIYGLVTALDGRRYVIK